MTAPTPAALDAKPLRMDAYYYGFEATGVYAIDLVLSAVAHAGKGSHHTDGWTDDVPLYEERLRGTSSVARIQNAASDAAETLAALQAQVETLTAENAHLESVIKARDAQLTQEIAMTSKFASDMLAADTARAAAEAALVEAREAIAAAVGMFDVCARNCLAISQSVEAGNYRGALNTLSDTVDICRDEKSWLRARAALEPRT